MLTAATWPGTCGTRSARTADDARSPATTIETVPFIPASIPSGEAGRPSPGSGAAGAPGAHSRTELRLCCARFNLSSVSSNCASRSFSRCTISGLALRRKSWLRSFFFTSSRSVSSFCASRARRAPSSSRSNRPSSGGDTPPPPPTPPAAPGGRGGRPLFVESDETVEREEPPPPLPHRRRRHGRARAVARERELLDAREGLHLGLELREQVELRALAAHHDRHQLAGRDLGFHAQVPHRDHDALEELDLALGRGVEPGLLRPRPRRGRQRLAIVRERLPKLLGHVRHERMEQAEG